MGKKERPTIAIVLLATAFFLAVSEIGVRLITRTSPETGMHLIGRVALLPYRPEAAAAQASWEAAGNSTYLARDEDLGWSILANGGAGDVTATAHGFRGAKNWATTASIPKGKIRISVYGDSFTHGDGVALEDTWADQLQRLRPGLEVLNFGVPAYGTDQALLRFRRDGRKFEAHFHLLGIWPENLVRNLSIVRFYLNPHGNLGTSKPRFELVDGKLLLVNSPVMPKDVFLDTVLQRKVSPLVEKDYWYRDDEQRFLALYHAQAIRAALSVYQAYERRAERNRLYFAKDGEALRVTVAIAEAFKREVEAGGARAYVSIIPMRDLLEEHGSGAFPLAEMLRERSVPLLDFGPAIASKAREMGAGALYRPDGHLSALGNRLIAEEINRRLSRELEAALR